MTDEPMATVPTRVLKGCLWLAEWVRETHRPDQQPTMLSGPDGLLPTLYNLIPPNERFVSPEEQTP